MSVNEKKGHQSFWDESQDRYREYLKSDEWKRKRNRRIEIDGNRCQCCGCRGTMRNPLDVHHLTYHSIYHEDVDKDLVTLCRSCHQGMHSVMNRITNSETGQRGWKDSLSVSTVTLTDSGTG